MKPRTKIQIETWRLHQQLRSTKKHEKFVISHHKHYYTKHYKNLVCLECNHMWKPDLQQWAEEAIGVKCPSCKKALNQIDCTRGEAQRIVTYSVLEVINGYQVVRYFSCWKTMRKNKKPSYWFNPLFEEWIDLAKNKKVIIGRCSSFNGDGFSSSEYEVRENRPGVYRSSHYDSFVSDINCPNPEFVPELQKYMLDSIDHNCDYRSLFTKVIASPKVETLLKAGQQELLFQAVHKDEAHEVYWPQVKMVIRHNYKITDAGIWYDYLRLLRDFGKDLLSPKYVLPEDFKAAHDHLVQKKQRKLAAERARRELLEQERQRELAAKVAELKEIKLELFKDLIFSRGKIKIVSLIEEADVELEGKVLNHCVHTNGYHMKSGILLMSAKVEGKSMETIELSLANYKVIQCRGRHNENSQYHDEILDILRKNMAKIKKLVEGNTKLHEADSELRKLKKAA